MKSLVFAEFDKMGGTRTYFERIGVFLSGYGEVVAAADRRMFDREMKDFLNRHKVRAIGMPVSGSVARLFEQLLGGRVYGAINRRLGELVRRTGLPTLIQLIRERPLLKRIVDSERPDLVLVSQAGGSRFFSLLSIGKAIIFVTHSLMPENPLKGPYARYFIRKAVQGGSSRMKIVGVSSSAAGNIRRHLRLPRETGRCLYVYNHGGSVEDDTRREPSGSVVVFTVGHVTDYKNPELWIRVAREVGSCSGGSIRFVWAGDGNLLQKCQMATRNNDNIRFVGLVRNVADYYRTSDIYFQPSKLESQGIGVVEAMKWALPCIVSNVGGLVESVADGKNGHVLEAADVGGMAAKILELAQDPGLRKQYGQEGRRRFEQVFCSETWTEKMDMLIAEVVRTT